MIRPYVIEITLQNLRIVLLKEKNFGPKFRLLLGYRKITKFKVIVQFRVFKHQFEKFIPPLFLFSRTNNNSF